MFRGNSHSELKRNGDLVLANMHACCVPYMTNFLVGKLVDNIMGNKSRFAFWPPMGGGPPITSCGAITSRPFPLADHEKNSASKNSKFSENYSKSMSSLYTENSIGQIG